MIVAITLMLLIIAIGAIVIFTAPADPGRFVTPAVNRKGGDSLRYDDVANTEKPIYLPFFVRVTHGSGVEHNVLIMATDISDATARAKITFPHDDVSVLAVPEDESEAYYDLDRVLVQ